MKVVLLAAGEGTRLGGLTEEVPKVLLPVNGVPIIEHTIRRLETQGFRDMYINLHHLPDAIRKHFGDGSRLGVNMTYSYEPEILGTAGAVRKLLPQLGSEPFLVVYGDNLTDCDFRQLVQAHGHSRAAATISVHWREEVTSSGVVVFDEKTGRIERLVEKPSPEEAAELGHCVSAGIFVLDKEIMELIPPGFSDFGRDVFPQALERGMALHAFKVKNVIWIDTPEAYERAQELWRKIAPT
ncbi:MAG: nucleotidyltransferase family protein [bacterium]|nr:nucleotidyltransferase family protein [bacterium]